MMYNKIVQFLNYGDKRACNKRIGPGGGTRRLHQKLRGRNRIDGRLKMIAFTRRDCHRYRRKNIIANDNYAPVAIAA